MSDLVESFFGTGNDLALSTVSDHSRAQLNEWIRLLDHPDRTSFLPREAEGRLFWYVFTPSDRRANEILDLLAAWIGPTYSDITINRGRLNLADAFDSKIADLAGIPTLKFEVLPRSSHANATVSRRFVREALTRLTTLLDNRPDSEFHLAKSTAEILDDLGHALSARDRDSADIALQSLAENGDLDTLNLSFIRVRALASLEDWDALIDDRSIGDLLQVSRPPGVTRALRRGFFHRFFAQLAVAERDSDLLSAGRDLNPEYRSVAQGPSAKHPDELFFQVALALTSDPPLPSELVEQMASTADELQTGLRSRLSRLISEAVRGQQGTREEIPPEAAAFALYAAGDPEAALRSVLLLPLTLATARLAILAAADVDNRDSATAALAFISTDLGVRADVERSKQMRTAVQSLGRLVGSEKPSDWPSWLDRVASGEDIAMAIDTAPRDFSQWAPMEFSDLADKLGAMSDDALIVFGEIAGQFLAAHRDVIEAAGVAGSVLARRLLAALAISCKSSAGVRTQTLNLVDLAFSGGFTPTEYSEIVNYINDIRQTNSSAGTVEWQADLFQSVTSYPRSSDPGGSMDAFVSGSLEDFIAFRYGLPMVTIRAIQIVCNEYPLDYPPVLAELLKQGEEESQPYAYLAGKSVGIYSLMESASGRAAQVLRSLVPGIEVRLFADKVGSTSLSQASSTVDIFVIVTAAAKHAASEFIESRRGGREVVRVNAKGTSAILNALRQAA